MVSEQADPGSQTGLTGTHLPTITRIIDENQLKAYAEVSGDHNPIHLDLAFAESTQFGGIIAHGMLTLAFVSEMMTVAFGTDWLASGSLKVRFKGAAYVGDKLETWGTVTKRESAGSHTLVTCSVGLKKSRDGQELISGNATVRAA